MSAPRRTVTVKTRRGAVAVAYRPNDITLSDYDHAETDPVGTAATLIVSCVARWSVADKRGERWPLTTDRVRELPCGLVLDIAKAIVEDVRSLVVAEIEQRKAVV